MTKNEKKRGLLIVIGIAALLLLVLVYFIFVWKSKTPVGPSVSQGGGELHHGWSPFYHATEGEWRMLDDECYVLKEQKFVSSEQERKEYLVATVESGGVLRIVGSRGRWKEVEVIEVGRVLAQGWIDADPIRRVLRLDDAPNPSLKESGLSGE